MFSILSALCVGFVLTVATTGALASASLERRRQSANKEASQLWRDIQLRNGVTEVSPWHSTDASINRPGMVQVHPRTQRPHTDAHLPSAGPPFTSDLATEPPEKQGSSDSATLNETVETVPELPMEPLELTDPPAAGEQARVLRLHRQGLTQNTVIKQVWGASAGGSKKYIEARRRYLDYIAQSANQSEVSHHA